MEVANFDFKILLPVVDVAIFDFKILMPVVEVALPAVEVAILKILLAAVEVAIIIFKFYFQLFKSQFLKGVYYKHFPRFRDPYKKMDF